MANTVKSIGAVLAGLITVVVLSTLTDVVMEKTGVFPPPGQGVLGNGLLAIALAYRCIYTLAGGYITAAIAPDRPMRLVSVLGIIGTILGCIGIYIGWNLSAHWYPIALAVTAFPLTWLGGKLKSK